MSLPALKNYADRRRLILVLAVVLAIGGLAGPALADTNPVVNVVGNTIFLLLSTIVMAMTKLFASLTGIFISLLVVVARYNTFLNAPIVQAGWPIVRDLMNMVFIIALLIISAGTVLRLQNYRYNRLLGKLIIMALLVNFSKFIAVFLLQFAQVVMLTFVNAFRDVAFGNFTHMFGLDAVLNFAWASSFSSTPAANSMGIFITLLAGLAMMLIAFVVMLAITIMLFVRIIALWLLIILSPIAYALRILPNTEKYASQWWAEFTKYAVLGPALAFFLWISLALVGGGSCQGTNLSCTTNPLTASNDAGFNTGFTQATTDTKTLRDDFATQILSLDRLITFVVGIIFLMMGLQYAQKSGAAGAAFAGKVAAAGFGAATFATGLNAIRDRTLAPVQGWYKNRQASRQSAIQQRTETLEAAGDRVAARYGPSRAGRERGAAAAATYETNRTARYAQQRGVKNMEEQPLMRGFLDRDADPRQRVAYMQELQNRKRLNFSDPGQLGAFNTLTGVLPGKRRGLTTGATYIAPAEQRKMREEMLKSNMDHMSANDVRAMAPQLRSPEEQKMMLDALDKKDAVRADNPADVAIVNSLRTNLRGVPASLKEFEDALKKSNPRMALQTVFNNFANGANDVNRLLSDANQGLFNTANLTERDYTTMIERTHQVNGISRDDARGQIANSIVDNSRNKQELDNVVDNMTLPVRARMFGGQTLDAGTAREKRDWMALKGYSGEAYQTEVNPSNGVSVYDQVHRNFVNNNAAVVGRNVREGKASRATLSHTPALRTMVENRSIGRSAIVEGFSTNPTSRNVVHDAGLQYLQTEDVAGQTTADRSTAEGRAQNDLRDLALIADYGANDDLDTIYTTTNATTRANPGVVRALREAKQFAIQRHLSELLALNPTSVSTPSYRDIHMFAAPGQINELAKKNPGLARMIAQNIRSIAETVHAGDNLYGEFVSRPEEASLRSRANTLRRSEVLA